MKTFLHFIVLFLFASYAQAQTPGVSIFYEQTSGDTRNYIEYIPGNLPIIISAPHGGVQQSGETIGGVFYPDNDNSLPDRSCGTNERDDNTEILVREIQKEIFEITGCYAHIIINNLHRSKLDPNREVNEATCGNLNATAHWNAFHGFIDQASASVEANWGKGLYIDLHGQNHTIPRIEIGYNINADELNSSDINASYIINNSTIRNLVNNNLNNLTHEELIRGNNSLGELLQNASGTLYRSLNYSDCGQNGYRAVPSATNNGGGSCDDTRPNGNEYFDGDFYNNRRHGSGSGTFDGIGGAGKIDGIMTEVNRRVRDLGTYNGRKYDKRQPTLIPFAKDYTAVLLNFINIHYNDYANFSYTSSMFETSGSNASPIVIGVNNGTFTAPAGLVINPTTGKIDISNSTVGTYTVTYAVGACGYFTSSKDISIVNNASQDDDEAPTAPMDLIATNTTETTTDISWTGSLDNFDVVGYNIYQNGVLIETIALSNYLITGLSPNTTYTFNITAVDPAGNESETSNDATITTLENVPLNYCASQSANVNDEYISNVQFESINNSSDARFYSDFTNISTEIVKNGQCIITITPTWSGTAYDEGYAVWIDYNHDGDFNDPGEQVWTQSPTTEASVSGMIVIPTSVPNGLTRMRVAMKYDAIPLPCEDFTYGEVEDYTVNIISAIPDTIPPIITLIGDAQVEVFLNSVYTDAGATAIDNVNGDITDLIQVTGTVNTAVAGTYTLFYNVRDAIGNTATEVVRTITVSSGLVERQGTTATKVKDASAIAELKDVNTLTVFPNPIRGSVLNIKLATGNVTSYKIVNVYGQTVLAGTTSNQIKVNTLKSGVYFIEVSDGAKTQTKKFIKQ